MKDVKKKTTHKNSQQVAAGRAGGLATAKKLSQEQRSESAKNAGKASGKARSAQKTISDLMNEIEGLKKQIDDLKSYKYISASDSAQQALIFLTKLMNNQNNYIRCRKEIAQFILSVAPELQRII
jgi:archaellum component FlaC